MYLIFFVHMYYCCHRVIFAMDSGYTLAYAYVNNGTYQLVYIRLLVACGILPVCYCTDAPTFSVARCLA